MVEKRGHSNYQLALKEWVDELKLAWSDMKADLKESRGQILFRQFEESLQSLEQLLKLDDSAITEADLTKRANLLYEHWNVLNDNADRRKEKSEMASGPVPIGGHKLPPLPYHYDALEPYIDEDTMRLHHTKHHQSYVDGLNKAEREMEKARNTGDFSLIKHWEREAAFNGAGHYLHTLFWNVMNPRGGGKPSGDLAAQINRDFGSFERFKNHFSEAANKVEGGGWAILVWSPRSHRLEILQAEKHQNLSQWDVIPIIALDVWEHAYYLQYKNEREAYVKNWWNVVDWNSANTRFNKAKQLKWQPF